MSKRMKILIVEDLEDDRRLFRYNITRHGHEVLEAANGEQALEIIEKKRPDLIVSDLLMPFMDGFALLKELKKHENLQDIPFIVYSSTYTGEKEKELAQALGADGFLIKSMEPEIIWQEIEKILAAIPAKPRKQSLLIEDHDFMKKYSSMVGARVEAKVRDLEKAKKELSSKEKQYRCLFQSMDDVILILDNDWNITDANQPALRNHLGYELDEIANKNFCTLFAETITYSELHDKICSGELVMKKNIELQASLIKKSGKQVTAHVSLSKLLDDKDAIIGSIAAIRDITARLKLEEQLRQTQKLESIGTLAGGIAHDFNNILTGILGYGELLSSALPSDSSEQHDALQIVKAANRAKDLVKQILTFSRRGQHTFQKLNAASVVKEALKLLRSTIPTSIEIRQDIDENCPPVIADPTQLHQIIMNICTNAYQAMKEKGGILAVRLSQKKISQQEFSGWHDYRPGTYQVIEISDTGPGIARDVVGKIFEPYFTTKAQGDGTGLGLSVVHGIVKAHGGHISVYSEKDRGTVFCVYLPLLQEEDIKNKEETNNKKPVQGKERILIVDDETLISEINTRFLKLFGYTVIAFNSSSEAWEAFQQSPNSYDLVITDLSMPGMSGMELCKKLLTLRPNLPIIMYTGFSDLVNKETARQAGARFFLMKPSTSEELARAVRTALDGA